MIWFGRGDFGNLFRNELGLVKEAKKRRPGWPGRRFWRDIVNKINGMSITSCSRSPSTCLLPVSFLRLPYSQSNVLKNFSFSWCVPPVCFNPVPTGYSSASIRFWMAPSWNPVPEGSCQPYRRSACRHFPFDVIAKDELTQDLAASISNIWAIATFSFFITRPPFLETAYLLRHPVTPGECFFFSSSLYSYEDTTDISICQLYLFSVIILEKYFYKETSSILLAKNRKKQEKYTIFRFDKKWHKKCL